MRSDDASSDVSKMTHPNDGRINLKIFTSFPERELLILETRPLDHDSKEIFKYICPICMRYFNSKPVILKNVDILLSDCCKNYLCLYCAKHLQQIELRNPHLQINCPQCTTPEFCLFDVDKEKPVRLDLF